MPKDLFLGHFLGPSKPCEAEKDLCKGLSVPYEAEKDLELSIDLGIPSFLSG